MSGDSTINPGSCPIPIEKYPHIVMAHGGGGRLTRQLINDMFRSAFSNDLLERDHDSAVINVESGSIAFTTDSFVIHPLFFPGGDIGELAVYGTVNDLSMSGAIPKYISLGLILEEGFAIETLWQIISSIKLASEKCGVSIVTGDTKVVEHGKCDGIYINTTGIGFVPDGLTISPASIKPGDAILLSGDIGRHGISVMAKREGLEFETDLESDCAPLHQAVKALINANLDIHCMRDLTRGGLAAALIELAETSNYSIEINEESIPVCDPVRGACELLGFDPKYVANEGRFIIILPKEQQEKALSILKTIPVSSNTVPIGKTLNTKTSQVVLLNAYGSRRILQLFSGEQLPRIC